jgi:thioredoxin-like negative regulator of GroEL
MQRPPLAVAGAEALRQAGQWTALQAWTEGKDWGPDADFMRWAYGMQAAHMLGENRPADELRRTLNSHADRNSAHALFAGSLLYSWGRAEEAEELWWLAAQHQDQSATDALGSLARHYQVRRDAEGQYRVFRQLHGLRPQDAAISNNYAFFALLTRRDQRKAEQLARANLAAEPQNQVYLATWAFALFMQNRAEEARRLLEPFAADAGRSPAVTFSYGLALAATGRQAEARPLLAGLSPESLTETEVKLIRATLGD